MKKIFFQKKNFQTNFFHLLLSCSKNQAIALLETANEEQVANTVIIIYNITLNSSVLSPQTQKLLSKHKKLISKITNRKNSDKKNYSIIRNNSSKIHNILLSAKKILIKVLK